MASDTKTLEAESEVTPLASEQVDLALPVAPRLAGPQSKKPSREGLG